MSRIIDQGLEEQSTLLVKMGEYTYETLSISLQGYLEGKSIQSEVREMSDILVAMANKIEDKTFQLIARFQPVACELGAIKSYMKIGNDFARYGRYALDISVINDQLNGLKECDQWVKDYISKMSVKVLSMVKTSVNALRAHEIEVAKSITTTEREVDQMYLIFLEKLTKIEKANGKCLLSSELMTRYLERIADHAVYVCESIVYVATGQKIALG